MPAICMVLVLFIGTTGPGSAAAADGRPPIDPAAFFHEHVKPILIGRCLECHGSERRGGLDLRTGTTALRGGESGPALQPGQAEDSLLFEYVASEQMPPDTPLTAEETAVLRRWIEQGAWFPDEPLDPLAVTTDYRAGYDWWSLQPLSSSAPPSPDGIPDLWTEHPIDRFVYAKLSENGLEPGPPAAPGDLVRRLWFDLTGLPPSPEDLAFWIPRLSRSNETDAEQSYRRLVDSLLNSPQYGAHWGRHWLDVARFGESTGFERNVLINNAWPYRDYVIRSLNEDKPFDRFIQEQLAGDVLAPGNPRVETGTAFLVCGPYDNVGNQDPVQAARIRADTIDEIIRTTGEAFLGLTIGCGRCHNHKFDPVTQEDYYAWYATFAGVRHGSRELATDDQRRQRDRVLRPLKQDRARLQKAREELEQDITARAEQQARQFEARWTREAPSRTGTVEQFPPQRVRFVRLTCLARDTHPNAATGYRIDEFEVWTAETEPQNVARADRGAVARGASRVARDFADAYSARLTIDGQFGAAWIAAEPSLTIELAEPSVVNRVVFSSDRTGQAGRHSVAAFVADYRIDVSEDGRRWTTVATSDDRRPVSDAHRQKRLFNLTIQKEERQRLQQMDRKLADIDRQIAAVAKLPTVQAGTFRTEPGPFRVFLGGDPQRPGAPVVPASLSAFSDTTKPYRLKADAADSERRLTLARWITSPENPLTARVLANRLWHYHFGTGIVDTPSDFGFMGSRPTHPKLLDWLARQVHRHNWRLKPLHRLIVTSQTWRQSAAWRPDAARIDADSRLLWRFPPRRLSAEEIRDTMLAVSGKLDLRAGGPGFRLYQYLEDNVATYIPLDTHGPDTYRRAVYHQNARAARVDLMTEFDAPDCAFAAPRRSTTTTPLQVLTMMNHQFTLDMAAALAERVVQEAAVPADTVADPDNVQAAQMDRLWKLCYGRPPTTEETDACRSLLEKYGLPALCRVLLNTNEFLFIH